MTFNPLAPYKGVMTRLILLYRHVIGLVIGGFITSVYNLPPHKKRWFRNPVKRISAFFLQVFIKKEFRKALFEVQLRRRLEMLGPTYIKLGQIMAIREDLLPKNITTELKMLLDQLPEIPFEHIKKIIEDSLNTPIKQLFLDIKPQPLGSASIGQTHRATTYHGKPVVVKVIKPGIKDTILSDLKLLEILSVVLEWIIPRYQPKVVVNEFRRYTIKEIDLTYEADHAETFTANFDGNSDVIFPKIYRELSSENVLTMAFFDGFKPTEANTNELSKRDKDKIIDIGLGAIIKMLYEDGFFHADLHAGNLIILPGPKIGFIDLGMVGRFDEKIKTHMLYYFNALVSGDIENVGKHLLAMTKSGDSADPAGFKREVSDLFRRYLLLAKYGNYSIAELILNSLNIGAKYHIFFPVEMTLMVKALVTFEGVGKAISPKIDIVKLSHKHVGDIYKRRFNPQNLYQQFARNLPELIETLVMFPKLVSDSSRSLEQFLNEGGGENPLAGIKSSLMAGALIIAGVLAFVQHADPFLWGGLFIASVFFMFYGK